MSFSERILSVFPTPSFISMPAAGLDISDHSIKFIEFSNITGTRRVGRFGSRDIPDGVIVGGSIVDRTRLVKELTAFREEHDIRFVRTSLPEEPAYIFTTTVPRVGDDETRSLLRFRLEENVPINPADAIVDFDVIEHEAAPKGERLVAVSVFPTTLAEEYTALLTAAGFEPLSLEIEAQAIARSIVPSGYRGTCMTADVGRNRSGISVVSDGIVRFTATVDVGGDALEPALRAAFPEGKEEDFVRIKNDEGLNHSEKPALRDALQQFGKSLRNEIERYYIYWQTHKEGKEGKIPHPTIERIILSGGHANLGGLTEYLESELFVPVSRADVWANAFSVDRYIPPISFEQSLGYASAIGLALHQDR